MKSDSAAGVLARGSSWSFFFRVATMAVSAITQIVVVRSLGEAAYGEYTYLLGWMNVVVIFTVFNVEYTAVKYVSMYESSGEVGLLRGFERAALRFTGGLSVAVALAIAVGVWWLAPPEDSHLVVPAVIVCAMLPIMTSVMVNAERLRGRKLIAQSHAHTLLRPSLFLLMLTAAVLLLNEAPPLAAVLLLNLIAMSVGAVVSAVLAHRAAAATHTATPRYRYREWMGTALGLLPSSIAQLALGSKMDIVIIGTAVDTTAAGVYSIASLLLQPSGFVITSVGTIAAPMIADLYANGRREELRRVLMLIARVNIGLTVPMVLGIYIISPLVLSWLGPTFLAGYPVVLLLGLTACSSTLGGHAAFMLTMTGHHHHASVIIAVSAALNLILAVVLGTAFGMVGVAIATAVAQIARSTALTVAATRLTGISLMPF